MIMSESGTAVFMVLIPFFLFFAIDSWVHGFVYHALIFAALTLFFEIIVLLSLLKKEDIKEGESK